jgi:V/A-type H+-transporting ATPase subunit I
MVMNGYRSLPDVSVIFWLVGLPALMLFMKAPLRFVRLKTRGAEKRFSLLTPIDFGMEWVVELLEVFAGYLSNTLSFMRVAGLGIAHVSLMVSFFELARMAQEASSSQVSIWAILILVVGNVIVIGLEGLTAGIQALRLNYYEFFTKFFRGSGEVFSPVSLTSRD